ncbi:MAG: large subunit ribosomal protein L4 [Microgenomates group bacterium Gr01-1014_7]|nr:MAG: large subunit ribosomal protein L4 [Microgenomates group bacterium Gr01-1014_7]
MPVKKLKVKSKKSKVTAKPVAKTATRASRLSVPVYSLSGRAAGTMSLPKEIFGAKVNKTLLAQAVRVYLTNQKLHSASTKTRGEVRGSTAKIFRQKGTGRARHGSIRAPIFVGGGIVFGPKPRKVRLDLPKKMKKAALLSALSAKASDKEIVGVSGLEKASGKTKEIVKLLEKVGKSVLIVTGEKQDMIVRGVRNIPGVDVIPANLINAYEILRHQFLVISREALAKFK